MQRKNSFIVLKIVLIFAGLYQNIEVSNPVRILIKLYCLLIGTWYIRLLYFAPNAMRVCVVAENWIMLSICLFSKEPFFFKYYNRAITFDYRTHVAKTIFSKYWKFVTTLFIIMLLFLIQNRFLNYMIALKFNKLQHLNYELEVLQFACAIGIDFAQGTTIATISILHCQMTIFESSVKRLGFPISPNHDEMYTFINECFSSVEQRVKFQVKSIPLVAAVNGRGIIYFCQVQSVLSLNVTVCFISNKINSTLATPITFWPLLPTG